MKSTDFAEYLTYKARETFLIRIARCRMAMLPLALAACDRAPVQQCRDFPRGMEMIDLDRSRLIESDIKLADPAILNEIKKCEPSVMYRGYSEELFLYRTFSDGSGTAYFLYSLQYTTDIGRTFEISMKDQKIKKSYFAPLSS